MPYDNTKALNCTRCEDGLFLSNGDEDMNGFTPVKCDLCGHEDESASLDDWFKHRITYGPKVTKSQKDRLKKRISEMI